MIICSRAGKTSLHLVIGPSSSGKTTYIETELIPKLGKPCPVFFRSRFDADSIQRHDTAILHAGMISPCSAFDIPGKNSLEFLEHLKVDALDVTAHILVASPAEHIKRILLRTDFELAVDSSQPYPTGHILRALNATDVKEVYHAFVCWCHKNGIAFDLFHATKGCFSALPDLDALDAVLDSKDDMSFSVLELSELARKFSYGLDQRSLFEVLDHVDGTSSPVELYEALQRSCGVLCDEHDVLTRIGIRAGRQGDLPTARQALQKAVRLDPGRAAPYYHLSCLHDRDCDIGPALAYIRKAVERDPQQGRYHHQLGLVLLRSGRREEAVEAFNAAYVLDPGLPGVGRDLGRDRVEDGPAPEMEQETVRDWKPWVSTAFRNVFRTR